MKKSLLLSFMAGMLAFTIIGCNNAEQKQPAKETNSSHNHHTEEQRDIAETTKGIDTLPSFSSGNDAQSELPTT